MESENWQKVKAIFDSAFEMGTSQRSSFLEIACANDEDLRHEVEDLLAASETAGSFMEVPLAHAVENLLPDDSKKQLEPGQSVGRYKIVGRIGEGGMGVVFLAQDYELDRQVALKILSNDAAADNDRLLRFVQEARSASALNHPNILTVHEIGSIGELHYIATELINGKTLRARLSMESLPLGKILDVAVQIATALNAAHETGIVHRDIKPENIMLRDDGLVKVLDFGLAKLTDRPSLKAGFEQTNTNMEGRTPAASDSLERFDVTTHVDTAPGMVIGTLNYMSPEQARGKATDARTDVWSLAVVLYEMLEQRRPFAGETASDTMAAILTSEPAPLNENVPLELQRIVKKSLQKSPDERYHTIKDLLLDIKHLKRELEFSEELDRLRIPAFPKSGDVGVTQSGKNVTEMHGATISTQNSLGRRKSYAVYLIRKVTRLKLGPALGILLCALVGFWLFYGNSPKDPTSINSVAVLPFLNVGGDSEQEYLSDGISEALIDSLSRLPQLKVIARGSSFHYKGKDIDPGEVARDLGVKTIIMGSLTRHGDDLDIRVEMINAADQTRMWGEIYNSKATEVQNIQEVIVRGISDNLRLRLAEDQQIAKSETTSPEAYGLSLKGAFLMRKGGYSNLKQAVELFEQAISIDPQYARAYARLSIAYSNIYGLGFGDPKEFQAKQEVAMSKAIDLDPSLEDGHNAMGVYFTHTFQWSEAEREYKRALEINQNFAGAHANYARLLSITKRHDQAVAETQRAIEIDPLRAEVYSVLPEVLVYAKRYDEAIDAARRAIEMNSKEPSGYLRLAEAYGRKKMYPEAIAAGRRSVELDEESLTSQVALGTALAQAGERGKAEKILNQTLRAEQYVSKADIARLYIALGEREKAVASLEKAYSERDSGMRFLAIDPAFEPIRTDPRVVDLLRRIGLRE